MKKIIIITGIISTALMVISCNGVRREPGRTYMPDMAYSRAYETYAERDSSIFTKSESDRGHKIFYNNIPVAGTMAQGDMASYLLKNDSTGYAQSADIINPITREAVNMKEAERLYLVNCGICHGPKLDGNGPLWKDGNGAFSSKPIALVGDAKYTAMKEGTMFHSLTYGKNAMGSYASQLTTRQRWEVIHYIKMKQGPVAPATASKDSAATAVVPAVVKK
jgi:mono/diheme cytochrome c family protein